MVTNIVCKKCMKNTIPERLTIIQNCESESESESVSVSVYGMSVCTCVCLCVVFRVVCVIVMHILIITLFI